MFCGGQSSIVWSVVCIMVLWGATTTPQVTAQPMPLTLFKDAASRQAVCNDGTPAGYYFRKGTSDRWLIFFEGGFWCWDEATCDGRWKTSRGLMSSTVWPKSVNYGGILSTDVPLNPAFGNATMVYVPYCSSDVFSGDRGPSSTSKWVFRGRSILQALVQDLGTLGIDTASSVAVAGCSAGAQTVVVNLDYVAGLLGYVTHAPVSGVMDAGWFMSEQPLVPWDTAPDIQFKDALALWNGQVDESCADANSENAWECYFSTVGVKYLKTRFFMHTEQYDAFQVPWDVGHGPPYNGTDMQYVMEMRSKFHTTLNDEINHPNGVWSAACFYHCVTMGPTYYQITIDGVTIADALAKWYNNPTEEVKMIDNCKGFNCSAHCPPS